MRPMRLSYQCAWAAAQDVVHGIPALPALLALSDTDAEQPNTESGTEPWWTPHERPGVSGGTGSELPWGDY